CDWCAHIRTQSRETGQRIGVRGRSAARDCAGVAGQQGNRIATLRLNYRRELPTRNKLVFVEGQFVQPTDDEAMPGIEIRQPAVTQEVVAVLHRYALAALRIDVQ